MSLSRAKGLHILLFHTMSAVYISNWFGFMLSYFVWYPDDVSLRTETCSSIKCDTVMLSI